MQSSRSTVPLVDGSAKDIPGKFIEAHIGGESRAWHLLQALCIKKFPMCSCSRSYSVVVLQLKFVHIHSSCVWEPMALQDTTVDEGVVVSIRVLPIAFASRMNNWPVPSVSCHHHESFHGCRRRWCSCHVLIAFWAVQLNGQGFTDQWRKEGILSGFNL